MNIFKEKRFASVALGHFVIDILNGQRIVILPFLSVLMGLSNTTLGIVGSVYVISAALMQPVFGWMSDRWGPKWLAAGGVLWMGAFLSLALILPGWVGITFLVIASLGSGMFHPAGAAQATSIGQESRDNRETVTASYFFLMGQMGYFIGPLVGGFLLHKWGLPGILVVSILAMPLGIYIAASLNGSRLGRSPKILKNPEMKKNGVKMGWLGILALVILTAAQSWAQQNISNFLPKYLSDLGQPATYYGMVASIYMLGSAFGNISAGYLGARFDKRWIVLISMGLAGAPIALFARFIDSGWLVVMVLLAGFFLGAAYTIVVVLGQKLIPGGMGLASGLILGFVFSSGALGVAFTGGLADLWGFDRVFLMTAAIALVGGFASLFLTRDEKKAG
jgi:FSR family fosmidomycin resistance protein-like MFS transporter